jgi:hypothetical protein
MRDPLNQELDDLRAENERLRAALKVEDRMKTTEATYPRLTTIAGCHAVEIDAGVFIRFQVKDGPVYSVQFRAPGRGIDLQDLRVEDELASALH